MSRTLWKPVNSSFRQRIRKSERVRFFEMNARRRVIAVVADLTFRNGREMTRNPGTGRRRRRRRPRGGTIARNQMTRRYVHTRWMQIGVNKSSSSWYAVIYFIRFDVGLVRTDDTSSTRGLYCTKYKYIILCTLYVHLYRDADDADNISYCAGARTGSAGETWRRRFRPAGCCVCVECTHTTSVLTWLRCT